MPPLKPIGPFMRFDRHFLPMLVVPALFIMSSCGSEDDGLGKRYPVSGTVTYNGAPLEKGDISFVTEDLTKNFGASGAIDKGSYVLSTGGSGDGARSANTR